MSPLRKNSAAGLPDPTTDLAKERSIRPLPSSPELANGEGLPPRGLSTAEALL